MSEPVIHDPTQTLDPVHAGETETPTDYWAVRLVVFLRVMAVGSLVQGLWH